MESKDKTILILSIITGLFLILGIFLFAKFNSNLSFIKRANDYEPYSKEAAEIMDEGIDKMMDPTFILLTNIANIIQWPMIILWGILFAKVTHRAKEKGKNMALWIAFAFLAPIAGIVIALKK